MISHIGCGDLQELALVFNAKRVVGRSHWQIGYWTNDHGVSANGF
jgi:hypothetical protein